jgi:hypothetical protein
MPLPVPEPGLVIGYGYLWRSEYEQGQEEGTKDRPCAIVLMARDEEGATTVTVVPVTHSPPANADDAVEIPMPTKRRLGLDDAPSWIVVTEINRFVWPGPDLRPVLRIEQERFDYGLLPPELFRRVRERLGACAAAIASGTSNIVTSTTRSWLASRIYPNLQLKIV